MTRLDPCWLKGPPVDPGGKKVDIESRRFAASQGDDVRDCQRRRERGQKKLPEQRQRGLAIQQHRQEKDREHPGDDHGHTEIAFEPESMSGRPRSWPGIRIN